MVSDNPIIADTLQQRITAKLRDGKQVEVIVPSIDFPIPVAEFNSSGGIVSFVSTDGTEWYILEGALLGMRIKVAPTSRAIGDAVTVEDLVYGRL